jgi:phosphatidylglycerophosphatase A
LNRPCVRWITVFGLGYRWPASGTWGSLPPVVVAGLFYLAAWVWRDDAAIVGWLSVVYRLVLVAILVAFSLACLMQGDGAEAKFLKKDPSQAVADETAGQCLPLLFLPVSYGSPGKALAVLLTAFVSFRLMDIIKPWPARGLQRVPSGWGILIDDLFAGAYAALITLAMWRWVL